MPWLIYMYTFPNNKRYIGQTSCSLAERQGKNFREYKRNPALNAAIKKYSVHNIRQDILFDNIQTRDEANRIESICILLFKTNCRRFKNPSYGYNLTDGGSSAKDYGDRVVCIENNTTYANAQVAALRLFGRKSIASSITACCRGIIHHAGGMHFLYAEEYTEAKATEKLNELRKTSKRSREVYCIEFKQSFSNAAEAARFIKDATGVETSSYHIMENCRGTESVAGGYHFLFAEDVTEDRIQKALLKPKTRFKSVICLETGTTYIRIKDASSELGITGNHISACCKGTRKTAGGYHWAYKEAV